MSTRLFVPGLVLCAALVLVPLAAGQADVPGRAEAVPAGVSASDWSSIRAAYDAGRHAAFPVANGYRARNPGQRWTTAFDGRGFIVTPDSGRWSWGLDLVRYGWGADERNVVQPQAVSACGGRVAYDWDDRLTEWYVNDGRGLEHGYTVHARPGGTIGELTLGLAIRGDLEAAVSGDDRDVRFVGAAGSNVLTYSGLRVVDADGHQLAARFDLTEVGLRLTVHDQGARYPLTIDPVAQQAYVKASNTGGNDGFGASVSVCGDTAVVGALREDSNATGVNGDQTNNSAENAGAAYVFVRNGAAWSQQAYLKASNTGAGDVFGSSVSVSGDTIVVGAHGERSNATGVNGDQGDNSAVNAGAAYVFVRSGVTWTQQAYLKASNTEAGDYFGYRNIAVSGDTIAVAARDEDSNATGVNGDQADNGAADAGAVYVFMRNGTTWSQQAYIKASNSGAADHFGESVSLAGDTLVVGANHEDSDATGVNGSQNNVTTNYNAGAAYVFVRNGTSWSQQGYLKASNTGQDDQFGSAVGVYGDTIAVGASRESSNATGVNGDQTNNSAPNAGAVYVFVHNGTTWVQEAYVKASNAGPEDRFGDQVSLRDDTLVVGAFAERSNATGVNGDQSDNSTPGAGAAYVFVRTGTEWTQLAYLKASNTEANDFFGQAVSVSGITVFVTAVAEDSNAAGIDGDDSNNSAADSGAAYVFDLDVAINRWNDIGFGLAGIAGVPQLTGTGDLSAGSVGTLALDSAAPSAPSLVFVSVTSTPMSFKCGTLAPVPELASIFIITSPMGEIPLAWSSWPSGLSGQSLYLQYAILDPAAICGVSLSNALRADVP